MSSICISNLVYGDVYTDLFLEYNLKSLVENVVGKAVLSDGDYFVFTDGKNIDRIKSHANYHALQEVFRFKFFVIDKGLGYAHRYGLQTVQLQHTLRHALDSKQLMHISCADVYYGPGFFANSFKRFLQGYDSVVTQPMRVAFESASSCLKQGVSDLDALFDVGFNNLHPLWMSADWDGRYFSKLPYHIIWSDDRSFCLRGFSLSPLVVVPKEWMLKASGCIDVSFVPFLESPYYATDWQEFPVLELQMLSSFYPPFLHKKASVDTVAFWAKKNIVPANIYNLNKYVMYKRSADAASQELIDRSQYIVKNIIDACEAMSIESGLMRESPAIHQQLEPLRSEVKAVHAEKRVLLAEIEHLKRLLDSR
jgi:hypothetical protein